MTLPQPAVRLGGPEAPGPLPGNGGEEQTWDVMESPMKEMVPLRINRSSLKAEKGVGLTNRRCEVGVVNVGKCEGLQHCDMEQTGHPSIQSADVFERL